MECNVDIMMTANGSTCTAIHWKFARLLSQRILDTDCMNGFSLNDVDPIEMSKSSYLMVYESMNVQTRGFCFHKTNS